MVSYDGGVKPQTRLVRVSQADAAKALCMPVDPIAADAEPSRDLGSIYQLACKLLAA
jgi:hypothetical protein